MQIIDQNLLELKGIDSQLEILEKKKENLRKEIFGYVEDNGLTDGYKNDFATVAYVEPKTVKIKDQKKLIDDLVAQDLPRYVIEIPTHFELKPEFTKDIKAGTFKHDEVQIETSNNLMVKFK